MFNYHISVLRFGLWCPVLVTWSCWATAAVEAAEFEYHVFDSSYTFQCELEEAITCFDVRKVNRILDQGVDLDFETTNGSSVLHFLLKLAEKEDEICDDIQEIFDKLLAFGAPIDKQDRFGRTPLHLAASCSSQMIKTLLEFGSKVDRQDNAGCTALMIACLVNPPDLLSTVIHFINYNCQVNLRDQNGCAALHYVCSNQKCDNKTRSQVLTKLFWSGALLNIKDNADYTPICYELERLWKNSKRRNNVHVKYDLSVLRLMLLGGAGIDCQENQKQATWLRNVIRDNLNLLYCVLDIITPTQRHSVLYRLQKYTWRTLANSDKDTNEVISKILAHTSRPINLKVISMTYIRHLLKDNLFQRVQLLEIPPTLQDNLLNL